MKAKAKDLSRVDEPDYSADMVHYAPPSGFDQVTLCGKTDWLLDKVEGRRTERPATCRHCIAIVKHVGEPARLLLLQHRDTPVSARAERAKLVLRAIAILEGK